ncbi:MAG: hypothetical protein JW919_01410 [Candidatus Omnitrophica bacterium]|nr:hypothetical protein [Candidatus Omnitrophota bacterium]
MKKLFLLAIVSLFILSSIGAYAADTSQPTVPPTDTTKDRASRAMNNIFYGPAETPDNMAETNTKGTQMDRCTAKTKTGVERGIARLVGGIWQLATFWYSDPGPAATAPGSTAAAK